VRVAAVLADARSRGWVVDWIIGRWQPGFRVRQWSLGDTGPSQWALTSFAVNRKPAQVIPLYLNLVLQPSAIAGYAKVNGIPVDTLTQGRGAEACEKGWTVRRFAGTGNRVPQMTKI